MFTTSFSNYSLLTELERSTIQRNEISILYIFENKFHLMKLNTLLVGMLFSICTFAQITITDTDIGSVGDVRIQKIDENPVGISLGNAGENQTWDFSDLTQDNINELNFIDPAETGFSATFPMANLAIENDGFHLFLSNSPNALYILGYVGDFGVYPLENPELILEFPTQYEDEFGFSVQLDSISLISEMETDIANGLQMMVPGIVAAKIRLDTSSMSYVDAWGTAILEGDEYDVLRVKKSSFATDTIFGIVPQSHEVYASNYQIFTPDYLSVNLFDTVHFSNLAMHNVVEVDEETWNTNGTQSNGGFEYYNDASHVFTEAGIYYYVCTPHVGMDMKGIIEVEENWDYVMSGVISSGESSTSYSWYTDDANIGMPLVEIYLNSEDEIEQVIYIGSDAVISSWDCVEGSCVEAANGNGIYNSSEECEEVCGSNSIKEINSNTIYPNPTKDNLHIELNGSKQIYSLLGELLITTDKDIVDVSRLSKGVYLIKTNNTTYKFMKE